ncbi:interferon alpha-3 [Cricetulus griseus]|uniref:Interferon alpha-3 n=1 Tax=Cricetulus griseus TaxID=10029 RepID=G3I0I2_CRIGR|nr:interferon alpha-3 [Cricetulus griseus]XP_027256320.1 interferon alpha-3 [Cricetulus griseus]EGV95210.1 Interferon alpha-6 [Cricetulus griseus]
MLPVLPLLLGLTLGCSKDCSLDRGAFWSMHSQRIEALGFLRKLKIMPVVPCLQDRNDFRCPWKKGPVTQGMQRVEATCCLSEMLGQVLHLFATEASRRAWPETMLRQLLNSLFYALEALEGTGERRLSCPPTFVLAIRTYFSRISGYLEGKRFSPCSWEIVRAEMQVALATLPVPPERSPKKRRIAMPESPLQ